MKQAYVLVCRSETALCLSEAALYLSETALYLGTIPLYLHNASPQMSHTHTYPDKSLYTQQTRPGMHPADTPVYLSCRHLPVYSILSTPTCLLYPVDTSLSLACRRLPVYSSI